MSKHHPHLGQIVSPLSVFYSQEYRESNQQARCANKESNHELLESLPPRDTLILPVYISRGRGVNSLQFMVLHTLGLWQAVKSSSYKVLVFKRHERLSQKLGNDKTIVVVQLELLAQFDAGSVQHQKILHGLFVIVKYILLL